MTEPHSAEVSPSATLRFDPVEEEKARDAASFAFGGGADAVASGSALDDALAAIAQRVSIITSARGTLHQRTFRTNSVDLITVDVPSFLKHDNGGRLLAAAHIPLVVLATLRFTLGLLLAVRPLGHRWSPSTVPLDGLLWARERRHGVPQERGLRGVLVPREALGARGQPGGDERKQGAHLELDLGRATLVVVHVALATVARRLAPAAPTTASSAAAHARFGEE